MEAVRETKKHKGGQILHATLGRGSSIRLKGLGFGLDLGFGLGIRLRVWVRFRLWLGRKLPE